MAQDNNDIIYNDEIFKEVFNRVRNCTMTSVERVYALYQAVIYVVNNDIPGDFVECGTWRGGSVMAIALTLKHLGCTSRKIYIYDTFEGMTIPSEYDVDLLGRPAINDYQDSVRCYSGLDEVQQNLRSTDYPFDNFIFIKGDVKDTIPKHMPAQISLLRLDTDWYDSTLNELQNLYPLLVAKGVLIIDDYGHWDGARRAVDEYFSLNDIKMLLNRIDYTGRIGIKF